MASPELVLRWADGSLNLMGWNDSVHGEYEVETLAEGTDWGNYESVRRSLRTALLDGSRTARDRDSNRQIPLSLRVASPSHDALAAGEQALDMIDGRRCELVWTPPAKLAVSPSVFIVDFAELRHEMDDLAYGRGELFYKLTLDCLPYAYSDEWVEIPALPAGVAIPVLVDDCSALTGWTADADTSAVLGDGGDFITITNAGTVRRTGLADLTTDRYLSVEYGGVRPTRVRVSATTDSGFTTVPQAGLDGRYALYDVGIAVDAIEFTFPGGPDGPDGLGGLASILTINKQSSMRTAASNGQVRTVATPGSRRTPATLTLDAGVDELGTAVVYSGPDYDPSLVNRLQAGSAHQVTDAVPTIRYVMPAAELPPGEYAVWADIAGSTTGTSLDFTAELRNGSTVLSEQVLATLTPEIDEVSMTLDWGGVQPRFTAQLPGWALADGSLLDFGLRVTKTGTGGIFIPWVWLFNITTGRLLVVECGGRQKMWVDPASLTRDYPTIWAGDTTQASAVPLTLDTEVRSWGGGVALTPPVSTLYTWSSDSAPSASARFRAAGHTHMAS